MRARSSLVGEWRGRPVLSDELRARLGAGVLWTLVVLAALGGVVSWARGTPAPAPAVAGDVEGSVSGSWAAAGFGARFVAAYLSAGEVDGQVLEGFLGYVPELPATQQQPGEPQPTVGVAAVELVGERYWAVTVAAGPVGSPAYWRVGVVDAGGGLVAVGLPTPAPAPPVGERPELAVPVSGAPPVDDPVVETVSGFVGAYVCRQGDLDRWLRPGLVVEPPATPVCAVAQLDRWGSRQLGEDRREVAAEAVLDPGPSARRVSLSVVVARRDGRWEIAEVLPAASLAGNEQEEP